MSRRPAMMGLARRVPADTVEADLRLYLKRAGALARAWGDAGWHRRRVGDAPGLRADRSLRFWSSDALEAAR